MSALARTSSAELARTESQRQATARLSAEAETLAIEAQNAEDEAELRRTLEDIAAALGADNEKEAARLAAGLRNSSGAAHLLNLSGSDGAMLRTSSRAPEAPLAAQLSPGPGKLPEGVPRKAPAYLVATQTRFSRRITIRSFMDRAAAQAAFEAGSKVDSRLLLEVDVVGQLTEVESWAIVRDAVRDQCVTEAKRWFEREQFRLLAHEDDGTGKHGWVEKQTGKTFLQEGRWDRLYLSMRDRVLVAHDAEDAVGTAPLMAFAMKDCVLKLPKTERKDRPHCMRLDFDAKSLRRAASDDPKLILDPLTEEEMVAWFMAMGRAGCRVPAEYAEKIYIEDETDKLPRGAMMDWVWVRTDPTNQNAIWEKRWCEWRHPVLSMHARPGSEPITVMDVEDCEVVTAPEDDAHSVDSLRKSVRISSSYAPAESVDDLDRAFSWVIMRTFLTIRLEIRRKFGI